MRVGKAILPTKHPDEPNLVCLKINRDWIPVLMTAIHRLEWAASWKDGTDIDRAEQDVYRLYHLLLSADETCQDETCFDFPPDIGFIEWFPNNPFTQPDLIGAGYNAPAWYVSNQVTKTVMTDISRFPAGSLPTIIPASGLPRLRVNASGPATIRINMFSIVGGSIAQVTVDDDPLTVEFVDLNKDIFSVPPETDEDVIIEREIEAGNHHIDIIIVSMANDEIPFVYHGGGVKSVEICGGEALLEPRFKFEGCTLYLSWDGGVNWQPVPGWDTYAPECFRGEDGAPGQDGQNGQDAQPFDLRFNNCALEYSRDGAQTWDMLPGWGDWLSCIPGGQSYDLRLRDGLLEWSKDGGQDWALVEGWETGIVQIVNDRDRCLNAWGCAFGLKELTAAFAGKMLQSATIEEYTTAVYEEWPNQFGSLIAPPAAVLSEFIDLTWGVPDKGALYDAIGQDENASELAARIYTVMPAGEWCEANLESFLNYFPCENTPTWLAAVVKMVDCMFTAPLEFFKRKMRALMFEYRGLGTCQNCTELTEIEPCGGAGRCHFFDFTQGTDNWYAYVGELTASGFKTVPYQFDVRYMSVGLSLPPAGTWGTMTARFVFANTNPEAQLWVYAVAAGQTILLIEKTVQQGGDTTVSIPANATQIICRGSCSLGDVYLESVMLDYTSDNLLWSDNCGRG